MLKEGAVNDTDTTPDEPPDAAPIVGAEDAPLVPALCDSMKCTRFLNNWLYLDTNHLSNFGADVISPTIRKFLYDNQLDR